MFLKLAMRVETAYRNARCSSETLVYPLRAWKEEPLLRTRTDIGIASCILIAVLRASLASGAQIDSPKGSTRETQAWYHYSR